MSFKHMGNTIDIFTDGGSRGNPGPAAIGVVFYNNSEIIYKFNKTIGVATNNEAEYTAILEALKILSRSKWFIDNNGKGEVNCFLDSQLVVEQINGNYKIKQPHILKFIEKIKELINQFDLKLTFSYIPREKNKEADKLVNLALDQELKEKNA